MFIDFLTLMLICVAASFLTIAGYLLFALHRPERQAAWAPVFGMLGIVLLVAGLRITWYWPLPGQFNVAYGESSVLLGILMLGAGISIAKGYSLLPWSIPAFLFGAVSLVIAAGFMQFNLTKEPLLTALGFLASGFGGILAFVPLAFPSKALFRYIGALVMIGAGLFWAASSYMAYFGHLEGFGKYLPPGMNAPM